jgi:type III secretory pathway lipoprotein EscJ
VADGKLQIDQRVDRIESAIMILAQENYPQETVDKIEQILKGKAYAEPWPVAQES